MSAAPERPDLEAMVDRIDAYGLPPISSGEWRAVVTYALRVEAQRDAAREVAGAAQRVVGNCWFSVQADRWLVARSMGACWSDAMAELSSALDRLGGGT